MGHSARKGFSKLTNLAEWKQRIIDKDSSFNTGSSKVVMMIMLLKVIEPL